MLLGKLNWIRNQQPALQQLRRIRFHSVSNDQIIAYSKRDGDSVVLTVVSLDPHHTQEGEVFIDLPAVGGLASNAVLSFHDELTEQSFSWGGAKNFVRLTPANPAHILVLQ